MIKLSKLCLILIAFCAVSFTYAQGIVGKWKTVDDATGETKGVVEFYKENDKIFGRVVKILHLNPEKQNEVCSNCKDDRKGKRILGMVILKNFMYTESDYYRGGKVLDPENGKEYQCYIKMLSDNKLKLRGFIGIPLIGRTQYWYRESDGE